VSYNLVLYSTLRSGPHTSALHAHSIQTALSGNCFWQLTAACTKQVVNGHNVHFMQMLPNLQHLAGFFMCVLRFRYKRDDDIDMTATLYLPPGYNKEKEGPLPCLIWAYPREFKSKDAAGKPFCQLPG